MIMSDNKAIRIECSGTESKPLDELIDFQDGIKKLPKKNLEKLADSILKYGFSAPFFIWQNEGSLYKLDGHQRGIALKYLRDEKGYTIPDLPVVYIEADSENQAREKLLHITSQYGEFDRQGLDAFILDYDLDTTHLDTIRLTDTELKIIEDFREETEGDDDIPEDVDPVTKPGDLWELGEHRLLCGDSTDLETVALLMNDKSADLYLTDPPYNVAYEGKTKDALTIQNDKMDDDSFRGFIVNAFFAAAEVMKKGASFYIWHADSEGYNFRGACRDTGLDVKQCIIWNKNTMVMGRQDYQWKHEPCLYGWKKGGAHSWYSDRKQTTVINFDKPSKNAEHPTMKPLDLFCYQIRNSTKSEDIVLDSFLGSGTSLLAAEKEGRVCYGIELDPHYCDIIVQRYIEWCTANQRPYKVFRNGEEFSI